MPPTTTTIWLTSCQSCFTNLSSYDAWTLCVAVLLQGVHLVYDEDWDAAYADGGVIPLNGERNMMLKIGNIVFVDLCQFLTTSLDNLVKALRKSGVDKFANTIRHFGCDDDYFEKGCYAYEYMTDESKLDETELPTKSAFYNCLVDEELDDEQHERAKQLRTKRYATGTISISSSTCSFSPTYSRPSDAR